MFYTTIVSLSSSALITITISSCAPAHLTICVFDDPNVKYKNVVSGFRHTHSKIIEYKVEKCYMSNYKHSKLASTL